MHSAMGTLRSNRIVIIELAKDEFINYVDLVRHTTEDERFWIDIFMLPKLETLPVEKHMYYTFFLAVDKNTAHVVSEFCFKGEPDDSGAVEFGYITVPEYRNMGYMTEMMELMIDISTNIPDIRTLVAIVGEDNEYSKKVLIKNNFYQHTGTTWYKSLR